MDTGSLTRVQPRVKWRDVWDIVWLDHQSIPVLPELTEKKSHDRGISVTDLHSRITDRMDAIRDMKDDFTGEMRRFLPPGNLLDAVGDARCWQYVLHLIPTMV